MIYRSVQKTIKIKSYTYNYFYKYQIENEALFDVIVQLAGGIGLFLLGMSLMTDSLKDMAGESLRQWLSKFTGSAYKALLSGIGFTLVLQSSTATTLATIGFVSAGVLTFTQAIGVVIGANIGTTSTGWMVALLGVKFSITHIALPLIAFGAILKLLTSGRIALIGLCLAGFGLIFFGIDQLQIAMSGMAQRIDLSVFSTESMFSKLLLVLIGLVMTILLQSSSAAITVTLAALASSTIQLEQALLLVIGQNVGTVATAVLAAIGAGVGAQRTAAVHVLFNVISAILALFILLPLFIWLYHHVQAVARLDHVLIVAAFHTAFSVLGAVFFMPLLQQMQAILIKVIPDREVPPHQYLDQASLAIPSIAIQTAQHVLYLHLYEQLNIFKQALKEGQLIHRQKLLEFDQLMIELDKYLEKIVLPESKEDRDKLISLLRIVVYARVFRSDLEQLNHVVLIRTQPKIYQIALDYLAILERCLDPLFLHNDQQVIQEFQKELSHLKQWMDEHRQDIRAEIVTYAQLHQLTAAKNVELLAAQRWLERLIAHTKRLANVLLDAHSN